ncbi:MAG TPA: DUF309 domain-containing protein [Gemmatimonadales bacterium]|nr:DUF309 domain-containing protein [Gemmatimonadales bacterium]
MSPETDVVVMRDCIVIGGGCYGTFYARQLAKAQARGRAKLRRVVVVDRDPACRARRELGEAADRTFVVSEWGAFLDGLLEDPGSELEDFIVPSPHMPHLLFEWVLARAQARWPDRRVSAEPLPGRLGTPYDRVSGTTRYVSFADWVCPTHCVEPALCPAIGATRTWEMSDALTRLVAELNRGRQRLSGPALFLCRHHVFGVGTIPVAAVRAADALVARTARTDAARVVIGTISSCHGAVSVVRVGPRPLGAAERRAVLERARELFNAGAYWEAHEALETVWRSIIETPAADVLQGLIQAAAALLHRARGNAHGVAVVGRAALEKLAGAQRPDIEFETERFRAELARALAGEGDPPRLEFRGHGRASA